MDDERRSLTSLISEVSALPQGDDVARAARSIAIALATARSRDLEPMAAPILRASGLSTGALTTSHGDPVAVLERGPTDAAERALAGALVARGIAISPPAGVDAEDRAVGELLWLAAHSPLDAFPALDAALGDRAVGPWGALCDLVRRIDAGREPAFDRADALTGAAALRLATHPDVVAARARLRDEVTDPAGREALAPSVASGERAPLEAAPALVGRVEPAPRGAIATTLLAMSGILAITGLARLLARVALARNERAEVEITSEGVRIRSRTEMLGKVVREADVLLPPGSLVRATREVRFPRLPLYAGLFALALGSYVGVSLFVDGARAASPSLLGQGLLVVMLGIALELGATTLVPGARGRCRIVLVPRRGASVCVGELDIDAADRTLARLRR
jgi:hypothetical protein